MKKIKLYERKPERLLALQFKRKNKNWSKWVHVYYRKDMFDQNKSIYQLEVKKEYSEETYLVDIWDDDWIIFDFWLNPIGIIKDNYFKRHFVLHDEKNEKDNKI